MSLPFEQVESLLDRARRGESVSREIERLPSAIREEVRSMLDGERLLRELTATTARSGDRYGPYVVSACIGRGGQATVYRARRADGAPSAPVIALKVLEGDASISEERRARFRREVSVAARVEHPGICPILDHGSSASALWIAMPFFPRGTLAERLAAAPRGAAMPIDEALRWVIAVARALHAAHERGVVHRDVKPGNLALDADGGPVVLDFGLAAFAEAEEAPLTRTSRPLGTPEYMAPERIEGRSGRVDRTVDVWSLGVVLFELLTGRRPFREPTREALYHAILRKDPDDPRRWVPALGRDLRRVLAASLERDPARRYQSTLELAEDLERVLAGRPVRIAPLPWTLRAGRAIRRHRTAATVGGAVLLGLSIALATSLVFLEGARDGERRASRAEQAERRARLREEGLRHLVEARQLLGSDPGAALEATLAAADRVEHAELNSCALEILFALRELRRVETGFRVDACAIAHDGDFAVLAGPSGTMHVPLATESAATRWSGRAAGAIELSPRGEFAFVGRADGSLVERRIRDGQVTARAELEVAARDLVVSPDGLQLAVLRDDGRWAVLDAHDLRPRCTGDENEAAAIGIAWFRAEAGELCWAVLSPQQIAIHGGRGERRRTIDITGPEALAFDVSGAAARIAVVDAQGRARFFDLDGRHVDTFRSPDSIRDIRFGPEGRRVVLASTEGSLSVRDVHSGLLEERLLGHRMRAQVRWCASGSELVSVTPDGELRVWRVGSADGARVVEARQRLRDAAFGPQGRLVAATSTGIAVFDAASFSRVRSVELPDPVMELEVHPRSASILSVDARGVVRVGGDRPGPWTPLVLPGRAARSVDAVFDDEGHVILLSSSSGRAGLFERDGTLRATLEGLAGSGRSAPPLAGFLGVDAATARELEDHCVAVSVLADPGRPALAIWSRADGRRRSQWPLPHPVRALAVSPEATTGVVLDVEGGVFLLHGEHGPRPLPGLPAFDRVALAPDGSSAALADRLGGITSIDLDTGESRWRVAAHRSPSTVLRHSPDGSVLASGARDGVLSLWAASTGQRILDYRGHGAALESVTFSPDGAIVVSSDELGSAHVWPADPLRRIRQIAADRR